MIDTLAQIRAALASQTMSPRLARRCQRLVERLEAPVRIAIFGLPDAGKNSFLLH